MNSTKSNTLPLQIVNYVIELAERGRNIPVISKNSDEQLFLTSTGGTRFDRHLELRGNITGILKTSKEHIKEKFLTGEFSLGYREAKDFYNTPIKVGDKVTIHNACDVIGVVDKIITEPLEILKLHGYSEYKAYLKYDRILRPVALVIVTHSLAYNSDTGLNELRSLEESNTKYVNTCDLIKVLYK